MKKIKLIKIDLSAYANSRLSTEIETIVANMLIEFKGDINRVVEYTNLTSDDVTKVLMKYYSQINKSVNSKDTSKSLEKAIENSISIIDKHIAEIKEKQEKAPNKILSTPRSLTALLDRAIELKKVTSMQYDFTINKLNDTIIKQKTLTKLESGEIENTQEAVENIASIYDQLEEFSCYKKEKPVTVVNTETNEVVNYKSIKDASEACDTDPTYLSRCIKNKTILKNKYKAFFS